MILVINFLLNISCYRDMFDLAPTFLMDLLRSVSELVNLLVSR